MVQLRMENTDEVVEQPVRMKGCLLIEQTLFNITSVDLLITESLELVIAMMLTAQFIIGDLMVAAVTEEPDVCLTGFLQDALERKGYGAVVVIVGPGIAAAGILNHLADGAFATRNIPDAARDIVEQDLGVMRGGGWVMVGGESLERIIVFVDGIEEAVGLLFAAEEHAIETQPFSTTQRR